MRFLIICPPWEPGAVRVLPGDGDLRDGAGCGLGFGSPRDPVGVLCNLICEHRTYERWTEESLRLAGARCGMRICQVRGLELIKARVL